MRLKILYIGSVQMSCSILDSMLSMPNIEIIGLVSLKNSTFNSDFSSLRRYSDKLKCPIFYYQKNDTALLNYINSLKPDVIYCFGWSKILPEEIIKIPTKGTFGFHPSLLPANRGRHPIIWSLALGLCETASTFFKMDKGVDSGPIVHQRKIDIQPSDNATSLYKKIAISAKNQIQDLTIQIINNSYEEISQTDIQSNSWRKRTDQDGLIDWRMSSDAIKCLVNSLTFPYPGAEFLYNGEKIKVWKVLKGNSSENNIETGKVLNIKSDVIEVKCWDGSIKLVDHTLINLPSIGSYL